MPPEALEPGRYFFIPSSPRDGDGNVFVVDEHAERLWLPNGTLRRSKRAWKASDRETPIGIERFETVRGRCGRFLEAKRRDNGRAQYAKLGVSLKVANMDRING